MFDKKAFADLLERAKGDRTNQAFADDSGISRAYISMLLNCRRDDPPSPDVIKKLAKAAHNNITYTHLMVAAGYVYWEDKDKAELYYFGAFQDLVDERPGLKLGGAVHEKDLLKNLLLEGRESYKVKQFDSEYLHLIPLVGKIAAGDPILAIENPDDYIVIDTRINRINGNDISEYFALEVTGRSMEPTIHDGEIVLVRKQEEVEIGQIGVFICNQEEATIKRFTREGGKVYLIPDNKQFPVQEYAEDCICLGRVLQSIHRDIK